MANGRKDFNHTNLPCEHAHVYLYLSDENLFTIIIEL